MRRTTIPITLPFVAAAFGCSGAEPAPSTAAKAAADPKPAATPFRPAAERNVHFTYETVIRDLPAGKPVRVWIPVPRDDDHQTITNLRFDPAEARITEEKVHGNRTLYLEIPSAKEPVVAIRLEFDVRRKAHINRPNNGGEAVEARGPSPDNPLYLNGSRLAPVEGEPARLAGQVTAAGDNDAVKLRKIYDYVVAHTDYDKSGQGWGQGSIDWVCREKRGNCTDFHALLMSMARSRRIPARFEMGFSFPTDKTEGEIAGYHCWMTAWIGGCGWVPVDASEASKRRNQREVVEYYFGGHDADRVAFNKGRDLLLEPRQMGEPLNYLIYPYVEVDGKSYDSKKVDRKFRFRDLAN